MLGCNVWHHRPILNMVCGGGGREERVCDRPARVITATARHDTTTKVTYRIHDIVDYWETSTAITNVNTIIMYMYMYIYIYREGTTITILSTLKILCPGCPN